MTLKNHGKFFSDDPPALLEKQEKEWRPIIEWFCERHSIDIQPSVSLSAPVFRCLQVVNMDKNPFGFSTKSRLCR